MTLLTVAQHHRITLKLPEVSWRNVPLEGVAPVWWAAWTGVGWLGLRATQGGWLSNPPRFSHARSIWDLFLGMHMSYRMPLWIHVLPRCVLGFFFERQTEIREPYATFGNVQTRHAVPRYGAVPGYDVVISLLLLVFSLWLVPIVIFGISKWHASWNHY